MFAVKRRELGVHSFNTVLRYYSLVGVISGTGTSAALTTSPIGFGSESLRVFSLNHTEWI